MKIQKEQKKFMVYFLYESLVKRYLLGIFSAGGATFGRRIRNCAVDKARHYRQKTLDNRRRARKLLCFGAKYPGNYRGKRFGVCGIQTEKQKMSMRSTFRHYNFPDYRNFNRSDDNGFFIENFFYTKYFLGHRNFGNNPGLPDHKRNVEQQSDGFCNLDNFHRMFCFVVFL